MRLTLCAPFGETRRTDIRVPEGWTLAQVASGHADAVTGCLVNGQFVEDWRPYRPAQTDQVTWYVRPQYGIDIAAIATLVVTAVISTAISLALSYLIRALTPTPSNQAGKPEQIFGIAGLTNTVALGTPKFLVYGTRRIYGHIIATRTEIAPDGKSTQFGILYFMGEGPIQAITDIQINDIPLAQFANVQTQVRLGDGNIDAILDFNTVSQVWSDNRTLALSTPIVYTTHGTAIERVTLIFATPGLFQVDADDGSVRGALHTIHIEYTTVSDGVYVDDPNSPLLWSDQTQAQRFQPFTLRFDHPDAWLIRVTLDATTNQGGAGPVLFNVQEEASGDLHYPTNALLAITGIASNQITSFDGMRASGLVQGRVVRKPVLVDGEWDGETYENAWTTNRAWVLRDLITDARVGMGHRIPESLWDDDAAVAAANYWDTEAHGITIDQCDALINDRRVAWDWIKTVLTEGKAALMPSGGKLKLIVDKLDDPHLLYSMPGNIIEGSLHHSKGRGEGKLPNTILGQFPDAAANYMLQPVAVEADDIGSEPTRSDLVTISTVTDVRRVYWMLNSQLKRNRLVQRHVTWQSPQTAMVSEPFDIVSLAYDTPDVQRGVSGFLSSDSTTTRLVLDRLVTLATSTTYALIIRHQQTNTVERTTVATGAGHWGAIAPTVALTEAPQPGDLWAIGVQNTALLTVQIDSVALDESGTYTLAASEVVPSVYDYPTPPETLGGGPSQVLRPLPLWAVSVAQGLALQPDGSYQQTLTFSVTPGVPSHSGVAQVSPSGPATMDLSLEEPGSADVIIRLNLVDYFKGATVTLLSGTGAGQGPNLITDYPEPQLRRCLLTDAWSPEPDATTIYQIDWPAFSAFGGFVIERTETTLTGLARPFAFMATVSGTEYTTPIDGTGGFAFRFTPIGVNGVHNQQGRWVAYATVTGDVGAPSAPAEYGSGSSDG